MSWSMWQEAAVIDVPSELMYSANKGHWSTIDEVAVWSLLDHYYHLQVISFILNLR